MTRRPRLAPLALFVVNVDCSSISLEPLESWCANHGRSYPAFVKVLRASGCEGLTLLGSSDIRLAQAPKAMAKRHGAIEKSPEKAQEKTIKSLLTAVKVQTAALKKPRLGKWEAAPKAKLKKKAVKTAAKPAKKKVRA